MELVGREGYKSWKNLPIEIDYLLLPSFVTLWIVPGRKQIVVRKSYVPIEADYVRYGQNEGRFVGVVDCVEAQKVVYFSHWTILPRFLR